MLFGLFVRDVPRALAVASAITALVVYLGMSLAKISSYANNPAVLSACAILASLAVIGVGVAVVRLRARLGAAHRAGARRVEGVNV